VNVIRLDAPQMREIKAADVTLSIGDVRTLLNSLALTVCEYSDLGLDALVTVMEMYRQMQELYGRMAHP
jgi:hypothetical protein